MLKKRAFMNLKKAGKTNPAYKKGVFLAAAKEWPCGHCTCSSVTKKCTYCMLKEGMRYYNVLLPLPTL